MHCYLRHFRFPYKYDRIYRIQFIIQYRTDFSRIPHTKISMIPHKFIKINKNLRMKILNRLN